MAGTGGMMAPSADAKIVNLHCGACGLPFDDSAALMAHIDVCEEAQGSDIMALDKARASMGKAIKELNGLLIDDINRWRDDGGQT